MKEALRVGAAVTAGVLPWGSQLPWNKGTAGLGSLFSAELAVVERIGSPSPALLVAAYSARLSRTAGRLAAQISGDFAFIAAIVPGVVDLVIDALAETIHWAILPLRYHLLVLALILPATLLGGRFGASFSPPAHVART